MRDPIELPTPRTMAKQRSKRYKQAAALVQAGKSYSLTDAISTVKKFPAPKLPGRCASRRLPSSRSSTPMASCSVLELMLR